MLLFPYKFIEISKIYNDYYDVKTIIICFTKSVSNIIEPYSSIHPYDYIFIKLNTKYNFISGGIL